MVAISSSHCFEATSLGRPDGGGEDERDILAKAQAGVARAFTQLVRAHQRSVYSLALRALASRADAEDLAQEVFLQLHLGLDRIESPDHLVYWLRRTVTHRAIDRIRQRNRRREAPDLATMADSSFAADSNSAAHSTAAAHSAATAEGEDPLLARHLGSLVAELPVIPRLVVVLRYQEDLDPAEIARVLDLSVNTVKSHLRRSLASLRARCTDRDTL